MFQEPQDAKMEEKKSQKYINSKRTEELRIVTVRSMVSIARLTRFELWPSHLVVV